MDIYARIKSQVESEPCPVHHKFPVANVLYDNVVLTCCCTDFEIDCYNEIIAILQGKVAEVSEVAMQSDDNRQALEDTAHAG